MARKTADDLWTIAELAGRVGMALADNFDGVASGRVRDVPDLRAIRYYTTIGLIDRPAELRGRTAYYGGRHLCQLVAIKRLQSQGLSLAQVQERLLNLGDRELEKLANVPTHLETASSDHLPRQSTLQRKCETSREDFWKASPATDRTRRTKVDLDKNPRPGVVTLVPLTAELSIAFETCRAITAEDVAALQAAAKPLQQLLIHRQLVHPHLERENHGQSASDTESR
jgi:DNA-binding transcriptional MerR regulator